MFSATSRQIMNSPLLNHPQDELLLASCAILAIIYTSLFRHVMNEQTPICIIEIVM